jgi:PAS domain S-box-containing protein
MTFLNGRDDGSVGDQPGRLADEVSAEQKAAALDEDRARLAAIVENMPAALIIVDLDGNIQLANERALKILGVDGEIPQREPQEWDVRTLEGRRYRPDELPLTRSLRTGEVVTNERLTLVAMDGSRIFVDASSAPVLDSTGQSIGALSLFQDVTEQERLERAGREFVTNAAHELQSPLAAIVSAIEVLQSGAKDSDERDVFLGHIERESARLARLARALLVLARAQIGFEAARDEIVPVQQLLTETVARLRVVPGVEVEVDCGREVAVVTNRELLEQAVANLAENAAKHTSAGRIVLGAAEREGGVEITVTDTGSGIAAAERSRVFDRFHRGPVEKEAGFGLGLAIVGAATDALGGEVELQSSVGAGTVVRLWLPNAASLTRR